ncbi:hypothetical protein ZOD2009_11275 [Haladaptatus paucihalophilus DX253]|uniref:Uncharacterized protein n=1 Tax=Haladaptatus paucihalophilus DX253 TaxID=797209 RepID=E7QTX5_HALPU|nr:hypothetical protein [Haladaptatus paucihalophilus]EFW92054.1 hypothetical protein ZOD2009_11275 [Haladaptatus paucihalophilus DX253]SHK87030.1 hypothetical protein SAMN05444342_2459 [Haladaptatus paucihalophilus DX253]
MALKDSHKNRRTVLKTIGASGFGIVAGTGITSAKKGSQYVGFTYDPVTREIYEPASAIINKSGDEISGRFQLNNRTGIINTKEQKVTVPLAKLNPVNRFSSTTVPSSTIYEDRSKNFGKQVPTSKAVGSDSNKIVPLSIEIHDAQNLTGVFKYPDERHGLGYALEPVEEFTTKAKARKSIKHSLKLRQQVEYGERTEYHPAANKLNK